MHLSIGLTFEARRLPYLTLPFHRSRALTLWCAWVQAVNVLLGGGRLGDNANYDSDEPPPFIERTDSSDALASLPRAIEPFWQCKVKEVPSSL